MFLYKYISLILFVCALSRAQIVQTIIIDFEKTTIKNDEQEYVCGTIHYEYPDHMCLVIHDPVDQWIFSGIDSMVIYYPEDSLAFKFKTLYPVTFPFFQAFLGIVQEDYGLSSIGYTLIDHTTDDNKLTTTWAPPVNAPADVGIFLLSYTQDKLTNAVYQTQEGDIISQTHYHDHTQYGAYNFPMVIEKYLFTNQDTIQETIVYTDPQFNCTIPDSLMNFSLPSYVSIEHIVW